MALNAEELAVIMRLQGAQEYNAQMQESAASTREFGAAGAQAGEESAAGMAKANKAGAAATAGAAGRAKQLKTIGSTMTKWVTIPAIAIAAVSSKMALDFHDSMNLIETQAGASAKEVQKQSQNILAFAASGKTASGPKELADALFQVESAGYRGSKAMQVLSASSDLAMISQTKVADTTQSVVSAMKSGIKGGQDLHKAIGTLNATVGAGRMHMQDLNSAISTGALSAFKAMGVNLPNVGAALATLTNQGQPAAAAMTRLRMAMTMMAASTPKAEGILKGIGLSSKELANTMRGPRGLVDAMQLLHDHLQGMSKTQQFQTLSGIFGARSAQAVLALVNSTHDLGSNLDHINKTSADVGKNLAAAKADPATKLRIAWAQLQTVLVRLGDKLLPVVIPMVQSLGNAIQQVFSFFSSLPKPVQSFIGKMIILAALAGPVIKLTLKILELRTAILALGAAEGEASAAGAAGGMLSSTGGMLAGGMRMARTGLMGAGIGYSVGNIATSAANKDYRDAGFELGGSLIGGIAGSFLGPEGTVLGMAAGSALGEAMSGLFAAEKKLKPGQDALAGSAKRTAGALHHQSEMSKSLSHWTRQLATAHHRAHAASQQVADATQRVNRLARQGKTDTHAYAVAVQQLTTARHRETAAEHAARSAAKLHGIELRRYKAVTKETVGTENNRIAVLRAARKHIDAQTREVFNNSKSQKALNDLQDRGDKIAGKLGTANKQLKASLADAAQQGGDRFKKSLQQIHPPQAQFNDATDKGRKLLDLAGGSIRKANRMLQAQQGDLQKTVQLWHAYNIQTGAAGRGTIGGPIPQPDIAPPGSHPVTGPGSPHHPHHGGPHRRILPRPTRDTPQATATDREAGGVTERHHHIYIGRKQVAEAVTTESENRAARR